MRRKRLSGGWNPRVERRGFRIARNTVVALLILVGGALGFFHNRFQGRAQTDPIVGTAQTIAVPAQILTARTKQGVSSTWRGWFGGVALERENETLRHDLATQILERERLQGVDAENERLRLLLEFTSAKNPKPQVAEVIAWLPSSQEQTILIARGSRDGLRRDQVVRTAEGLLGKLVDVGPISSKVRLLNDADSAAGAVLSNGKVFGILRGVEESEGKLSHRYVLDMVHLDKQADIKVGDSVVTSGQGGVFPPGIPIGTVESIREDPSHLLKIARVTPYAPLPGAVREVLVLAGRP